MEILYWALLIAGGFLCGGIMFCVFIPRKILHINICEISIDNNPGAFNAIKYCGFKIGLLCLFFDLLKGFVPMILASIFMGANNIAFSLVMVAPVLGHAVGLFNHFHGGKCITTSFGVMLGLLPVTWIGIVTLIILYLLFSTVIKIKNGSIRSVVVFGFFAIVACTLLGILKMTYSAIGCGLVALMPIIKFFCSKNGFVKNNYRDKTDADNRFYKHGK